MLPWPVKYNQPPAVINTAHGTPVGMRRDSAGPFPLRYVLFHRFVLFLSQSILAATQQHLCCSPPCLYLVTRAGLQFWEHSPTSVSHLEAGVFVLHCIDLL